MSSQSITGSGQTIEQTLQVILHRLDVIKEKMEPLQPLTKVAELEAWVHEQGQQHQALNTAIDRVETTQSTPSTLVTLGRWY
jgi:hypothetical protein